MGGSKQKRQERKQEKLAWFLEQEEKRKEIERKRRGREGTIKTSYNGVQGSSERKNLLGE